MIIKTVAFKRKKESPQEVGIEVEACIIIDENGDVVPMPIYYKVDVIGLIIDFGPILDEISKKQFNL